MLPYLRVGKTVTMDRVVPPNRVNVNKFLEDKYQLLHSINLTPWIYGSYLYGVINTGDLDLWFTGPQPSWHDLDNLFFELHEYSLKVCKVKVDLKWVSTTIDKTIIPNPDTKSDEKWLHNYFEHAQTTPCISTFLDDYYVWDRSNDPGWEKVSDYIIKGCALNKPVHKKLYPRLNKDGVLKHQTVKDFLQNNSKF